MGRVLGDRARAAAAVRQRRAGEGRGAPRAGAETYDAVMKVFRHVYRTDILQPLVVALFLFQIGTGLFFAWRLTAAPTDRFRTFQIASGVYLAFYVLGHMDSVFVFARTYLGIDTGWS